MAGLEPASTGASGAIDAARPGSGRGGPGGHDPAVEDELNQAESKLVLDQVVLNCMAKSKEDDISHMEKALQSSTLRVEETLNKASGEVQDLAKRRGHNLWCGDVDVQGLREEACGSEYGSGNSVSEAPAQSAMPSESDPVFDPVFAASDTQDAVEAKKTRSEGRDAEVDEKMQRWQQRRKERRERLRKQPKWNYGRAARAMYQQHFASEDLIAALCARGIEMTQVSQIGEGSFARVFKGLWVTRDEVVVVKIIRKGVFHTEVDIPPAATGEQELAQDGQDGAVCPMRHPTWLLREIEVQQNHCHPNLVRILWACLDGLPYIMIFEHCAGGSLHALLHRPLFESPTHQRLSRMQADRSTSSPSASASLREGHDSLSSNGTSTFSAMFGGQSRNITMDDLGELVTNLNMAKAVDLSRLCWRQRVIIALDVARGMEDLHARGYIHRDLRPDNVLLAEPVTSLAQVPHAKVGDFGLSRRLPMRRGSDLMTCEVGTVPYMAPELFSRSSGEDARPYDEHADVYSYSVLVSELLTDQLPYVGTPVEHAARHRIIEFVLGGGRPQVTQVAEMPEVLHDLMVRCWSENPRGRPEFSSVKHELERELGAMSVEVNRSAVPGTDEAEDVPTSVRADG